jgi:hypothetical protein
MTLDNAAAARVRLIVWCKPRAEVAFGASLSIRRFVTKAHSCPNLVTNSV